MAEGQAREVLRIVEPQTVTDGAGVRLQRSIASSALDYVDPFLLLDHFGSDNPSDYIAGFPMHPHRGIETVTYMLAGVVNHRDSIGNAGSIQAGDVQWMTAGRGIMHEEMPGHQAGRLSGFQLWVNLPARDKMTEPRYQEVPEIQHEDGVLIRVIAGEVEGTTGAVTEIVAEPTYLDVSVPADGSFTQPIARGHTAFAYVFEGQAILDGGSVGNGKTVISPKLVVFDDGNYVLVRAGGEPLRFLLVSGKPLHEPVVRYGPFVMNTVEEIEQTLQDLRNGTFV
jgi:redox-sensitive bicupin YhaK (pirin superfamily)